MQTNFQTMFAKGVTIPQETLCPEVSPPANIPNPMVASRLAKLRSLSSDNIVEFGKEDGDKMVRLSDEVTKKVTIADSGEFSEGIMSIMKLTNSVDINSLSDAKKSGLGGLIHKVKGMIKDAKVEVLAQFNDASTEIDRVANTLSTAVQRMKQDAIWLQKNYDENLNYLHSTELNIEALQVFLNEETEKLNLMQQSQMDAMEIADQRRKVDRIERQLDKTIKLAHVSRLTAPEIRLMQETNFNNSEDFSELISVAIPAWKKKMGLALLALRQKKDTELSNAVKDQTNQLFKQAADMIHDNSIAAAENRQKSFVELETIQHMQNQQIDAVRRVKQIEEQGRLKRQQSAASIAQMTEDLRKEMSTW